jgi:hypothetical protein
VGDSPENLGQEARDASSGDEQGEESGKAIVADEGEKAREENGEMCGKNVGDSFMKYGRGSFAQDIPATLDASHDMCSEV